MIDLLAMAKEAIQRKLIKKIKTLSVREQGQLLAQLKEKDND